MGIPMLVRKSQFCLNGHSVHIELIGRLNNCRPIAAGGPASAQNSRDTRACGEFREADGKRSRPTLSDFTQHIRYLSRFDCSMMTVSYTHLTLPTIFRV